MEGSKTPDPQSQHSVARRDQPAALRALCCCSAVLLAAQSSSGPKSGTGIPFSLSSCSIKGFACSSKAFWIRAKACQDSRNRKGFWLRANTCCTPTAPTELQHSNVATDNTSLINRSLPILTSRLMIYVVRCILWDLTHEYDALLTTRPAYLLGKAARMCKA